MACKRCSWHLWSISRKVVKTPASVRRVEIPAKYETKTVRRLVEDAREVRTAIPAVYDTVSRRIQVKPESLEWRSVLCETNTSLDTIQDVQRALSRAGYNPGGSLTLDTLKKLGVRH